MSDSIQEAMANMGATFIAEARVGFRDSARAYKTAKGEVGGFLALLQTFESMCDPSKPLDKDATVREIMSVIGHQNHKQILMALRPAVARLLNAINEMEKP
jgi:hypothetical protein